ncbi:hypothetical protein EYF80_021812 [Liparis tanakae]|uniref:Uncharacterized protein n=1 Tax=Liparis tanakae TaxID=230148 RepID=A0A4Z2HQV4_9TELE|nr:hypothetical protein EYF80_021812 [Liparis tanakae]
MRGNQPLMGVSSTANEADFTPRAFLAVIMWMMGVTTKSEDLRVLRECISTWEKPTVHGEQGSAAVSMHLGEQ